MMRIFKKIAVFFVLVTSVFIVSCSKNDSGFESENMLSSSEKEIKNNEKITKSIVASDAESIMEAVNTVANIIPGEEFTVSVPEELDGLPSFDLGYHSFLNNKDAYDNFVKCFSEIFPDVEFKPEYTMFSGEKYDAISLAYSEETEKVRMYVWNEEGLRGEEATKRIEELIKEKNLVKPVIPLVEDYKDEVFDDKTQVFMYIYQDKGDDKVFMEAQSPVGNGLFRFNRGVIAKRHFKNDDFPDMLEAYDQLSYFGGFKKEVPADSEEEVNMLDKTVKVKDAVAVFESYINSLECIENKSADLKVKYVNIYELHGVEGLQMICTSTYKGIDFDGINGTSSYTEGDSGYQIFCYGSMINSFEVDSIYNIPVSFRYIDEKESYDMISAAEAVKLVSKEMSQTVEFELRKVELVYFVESINGKSTMPEDLSLETKVSWKLSLYNKNDRITYVCYVNAEDGGNFHYYKEIPE